MSLIKNQDQSGAPEDRIKIHCDEAQVKLYELIDENFEKIQENVDTFIDH